MPPLHYVGVDVSKDTLVVACGRYRGEFPNTPTGHRKFIAQLQKSFERAQVVCESTGPYHLRLCLALQTASVAFTIINPKRIFHHLRSDGREAKNDPMDALAIEKFAIAKQPQPSPPLKAEQIALVELLSHRSHLTEVVKVLRTHRQQVLSSLAGKELDRSLAQFEKQIAALEQKLRAIVEADPAMQKALEVLSAVKGVGFITAITLLAHMPELGTLNRAQCGALAGLAPFDNESGKFRGKRTIRGGRPEVRQALYMAGLVASRFNPVLKPVYQRLIAGKKPFKVAIVAVMRKLLLYLNSLLKPAPTALT